MCLKALSRIWRLERRRMQKGHRLQTHSALSRLSRSSRAILRVFHVFGAPEMLDLFLLSVSTFTKRPILLLLILLAKVAGQSTIGWFPCCSEVVTTATEAANSPTAIKIAVARAGAAAAAAAIVAVPVAVCCLLFAVCCLQFAKNTAGLATRAAPVAWPLPPP